MFRTKANSWFLLLAGIIPSILILWATWETGSLVDQMIQVFTKILGLAFFILIPCFIAMYLAETVFPKLEAGKKWLIALLYLPITVTVYWAIYSLLDAKFKPGRGSSTDSLVVVLPVFYGIPVLMVVYFVLIFFMKRKKTGLN